LRVDAAGSAPALLLRPWEDGDVAALVEAYQDPALHLWTNQTVSNEEDAARWLEARRRGWAVGDRPSFAVLEEPAGQDGSRPVAHVVLKKTDPTGPAAEVGYWTAARARGRGVASRALGALSAWAFETFAAEGLQRLDLLHQVDNAASCRVAEKCGFTFAQVLPPNPPYPLEGHLHSRTARLPRPGGGQPAASR
jgi:RimJ/RimL family protein N-acetyltransferase